MADPATRNATLLLTATRPLEALGRVAAFRGLIVDKLGVTLLGNRLNTLTHGARPPLFVVRVTAGSMRRIGRFYSVAAAVPGDGAKTALAATFAEVERMAQHGVTAAELDREKRALLVQLHHDSVKAPARSSADLAHDYVHHYLEGSPAMSPGQLLALARRILPEITLEDLAEFARVFRDDKNRALLVTTPAASDAAPTRNALRTVLDSVAGVKLEPYAPKVSHGLGTLLTKLPEPGRIVEERWHEALGVTEWRLSNGARVVLKPTAFNPGQFLIRGVSPGGLSLASDADYVSARFASAMIGAGGLGDYSQDELAERLTGRAFRRAGITVGDRTETIYADGSPREAELLFQLLYLWFTEPRLDTAAVTRWKASEKALLGQHGLTPNAIVTELLGQRHARTKPVNAAMVDSADAERALRFIRERFGDAADFTFLIVGAFEPEQIRPLVERYLGGLPSRGVREVPRDVGIRTPAGAVRVRVPFFTEPKAGVFLTFTGPFEVSRENMYLLSTLVELFERALIARLREEAGGTYDVAVRPAIVREDTARYRVMINFASAPERVDELTAAVFDVVKTLRDEGPAERDLAAVLTMYSRRLEASLRTNEYWAQQLEQHLLLDWPLDETILSPTVGRVSPPTVNELREVARRYLDPSRYVLVTLVPREGGKATSMGSK